MKKLLLKTMLLLCALVAGSTGVWADTKTEGFEKGSAGSNYQSTVNVSDAQSDCGISWEIYYGCVSTSSKITGNNSAALRLYTSANYGYLKTTTAIDGLTNVTLKAKAATTNGAAIKVNVSYSTNGSSWTAIESEKSIASTATQYSFDIPSGGKYFQIAISENSTKPSSKNAQLTIDDVVFTYTQKYTLTYDGNGGSGTMTDGSSPYVSGTTVTTLTNTFTRDGYVFDHWNTAADNSGTTYTEGANFTITGNTTLYAQWQLSGSDYISVSPFTKDVTSDGEDVEFTVVTDQTLDDNPTQFYTTVDGDVATSQPSWIDALYDEGTLLLAIEENTGAARTAYFRVEKGSVKSNVITINQAAYVAPPAGDPYTLFAGNLVEGDYVIYYDGYAMNTTVSSDRLQYAKVTPSNNVIITEDASIVWHIAPSGNYWTLYNEDVDAYSASTGVKNKIQLLESGTDDKSLWTVSGTTAYEFVNKKNNASEINANLRNNGDYGFACYASGTGGALSLYKKLAVKLNANGYATFSCTVPIDFSKAVDFTAWQVTGVSGTTITFTQVTDKVAANTGVLLMGTAGETVSPSVAASGSDISSTNKLVATTTVTNATADKYYGLSGNEFVKVNAGEVSGGKALLPTEALDVKALSLEFEGADGINAINPQPVRNNAIYDLSGRRVAKATKGLYIVNGKKVVK